MTVTGSRPGIVVRAWMKLTNGLLLERLLAGISKLGLAILPYYLMIERMMEDRPPSPDVDPEDYQVGWLGAEDMKEIASIPGRGISEEKLLRRLHEGKKCLGIKQRGRIVAFTWFDLKECHLRVQRFPVKDNEAYLFDAYTIVEFRGKGIAPYMRYQCYRELGKMGRNRFYSVSVALNRPAMKFKTKLGARPLELRLYLALFKRWEANWLLKTFGPESPSPAPGLKEVR